MNTKLLSAYGRYARANPRILAEGRQWYADARRTIDTLFPDQHDRYALVAIAAWNQRWSSTLASAHNLLHGIGTTAQLNTLRTGINPRTQMKTMEFAKALSGDRDSCPIDRWMLRAFGLSDKQLTYTTYYRVVKQFCNWNNRFQLTPCIADAQAVIWCAIRDAYPTPC